MIIEQRFHKQIIGSKGEKIREIRDRFNGIQVSFPEPGEKKDIVTLRGPKQDVEKCATHLKKMVVDLVGGGREGGREGEGGREMMRGIGGRRGSYEQNKTLPLSLSRLRPTTRKR